MKIKNVHASKDNTKKVKRQATGWERIFANQISNQGLYLEHIKNSYNSMRKRQSKKWAKDLNRHFSKEDIQIANKHMKRYSTSEKCKSELRDTTSHPIRMTTIEKTNKKHHHGLSQMWPGCGEIGTLNFQWECEMVALEKSDNFSND